MKQTVDEASDKGFSVFGKTRVISIVITIAIVVGGLLFLCTCCCCCFYGSSSANNQQHPSRPSQQPVGNYRYPTPPARVEPVANCSHGISQRCLRRLSLGSDCCACRDSRETTPFLDKEVRIAAYCQPCKSSWEVAPVTIWPASWRAQLPSSLPATIPRRAVPCSHPTKDICFELRGIPQLCCTCRDTRAAVLSKAARIEDYCPTCTLFWTQIPSELCPPEWKLAQLQCQHKRSQDCKKVKGAEASCCTCKDDRIRRLTKSERLRPYCDSCTTFWNAKPANELPASWKLACTHGATGKKCTFAASVGCCACTDARTGDLSKDQRLDSYCTSCKAGWKYVPPGDCPVEWNLKCPHNRAFAWESKAGTLWIRKGPCCCACRDKSTARQTKQKRLSSYCRDCKTLWERTPDESCPKEWGLLGGAPQSIISGTGGNPRPSLVKRVGKARTRTAICQTHPQVQCLEATIGGVPKCCACRDLGKKGTLSDRVRCYCLACRNHWDKQPGRSWPFPASLINEWASFPVLKPLPSGKMPSGRVSFPAEEKSASKLFDEGPRRGPPRFGDSNPINHAVTLAPAPDAMPSPKLTGRATRRASRRPIQLERKHPPTSSRSSKESALAFVTVMTRQIPTKDTPESKKEWSQYEDERGPLRDRGPRFSVPALVPVRPQSPENRPTEKSKRPQSEASRRGKSILATMALLTRYCC